MARTNIFIWKCNGSCEIVVQKYFQKEILKIYFAHCLKPVSSLYYKTYFLKCLTDKGFRGSIKVNAIFEK
jgi:hypothetical protein